MNTQYEQEKIGSKHDKIASVLSMLILMAAPFNTAIADSDNLPAMNSELAGCYSSDSEQFSLSSLCLFANGSYFYPKHISQSGKYRLQNNRIVFTPKDRGLFSVYGRHNPEASNQQTLFYFSGFDHESLVNFNKQGFNMMPTNEKCLSSYQLSPYEHDNQVVHLSLAHAPQNTDSFIAFDYQIEPHINEVLLIAQNPSKSSLSFSGRFIHDGNDRWLQLNKDSLSMAKIDFSAQKLNIVNQISQQSGYTERRYELLNQDNAPTFQELKRYRLDKPSNKYFAKNARVDPNASSKPEKYLKRYDKIAEVSQSMSTAFVDFRPVEVQIDCNL